VAGALHPHLVLAGVATGGVVLDLREQAERREALGGVVDLVGGPDLDPEVVHDRGAVGLALQQDQLQGRLSHREVGVAGAALGRLHAEQRAVEADRALQVGDPQGELHTGHGVLLGLL
jgi:hypothetical protein